jgi:hypothetical protein
VYRILATESVQSPSGDSVVTHGVRLAFLVRCRESERQEVPEASATDPTRTTNKSG